MTTVEVHRMKSPSLWLFQRDDMEAVPGYLSLHQNADIMTLKWTPNQLMNGSVGDLDYERRCKMIHLQMDCDYGDYVCLQRLSLIILIILFIFTMPGMYYGSLKTFRPNSSPLLCCICLTLSCC